MRVGAGAEPHPDNKPVKALAKEKNASERVKTVDRAFLYINERSLNSRVLLPIDCCFEPLL